MSSATTTTDHQEIRNWVEKRGGRPARVKGTGEPGVLRIDFREPDEDLEEISWEDFFDAFESQSLAFLHQDAIDGNESRFNKFVRRS